MGQRRRQRAHSIPSLRGKQERAFRPTASAMSRHFSHLCRPRWLSHLPERRTLCRRRYVGCFRIVCCSDGVGGAECGGSSRQCQYRVLLAGQQAEGRWSIRLSRHHQRQQQRSRTHRFQRDTGIRSSHRPRLHRCVCSCEPLERRYRRAHIPLDRFFQFSCHRRRIK